MSGRVKGAPAGPEAEREQLRELARRLHEAAQDARDAARELRAARDQTAAAARDSIRELAAPLVNKAIEEISGHLETQTRMVAEYLDRITATADSCARHANEAVEFIENAAKLTEARLMRYESTDEVAAMAVNGISAAVRDLAVDQEFIKNVADAVARDGRVRRRG